MRGLADQESCLTAQASSKVEADRQRLQQAEQSLGQELVRLMSVCDAPTRMQAEEADSRMQAETSLAYQNALACEFASKLQEIAALAGYTTLPELRGGAGNDGTFTAHNILWKVMDYTFIIAPFDGFWRFMDSGQQFKELDAKFSAQELERARQSFRQVAQQIAQANPSWDSQQIEYTISRGRSDAERATQPGATPGLQVGSDKHKDWKVPSWFSSD